MPPGSLSLPNGQGLSYPGDDGTPVTHGVAPNDLTDNRARDAFAGTPRHKFVPAKVERLGAGLLG